MLAHTVQLHVTGVVESDKVPLGTPESVIFCEHVVIDGRDVFTDGLISIAIDGNKGFVVLELREPTDDRRAYLEEHRLKVNDLTDFRATLTADDWLEGTDDEVILLAVHSLEVVQYQAPVLPGLQDKST